MRELMRAMELLQRADNIKAARDSRYRKFSRRWLAETKRAASLQAKAARIRREALHRWSTQIVRDACDLTVITPSVKEATASPRGNEKNWGANVESVSKLNRNTLNQAPAMAVQMLAYKAEEAGIRCDIIEDEAPKIAIGPAMVQAGRKFRRKARTVRKETAK